jgi:hypothetical protein
MYREMDIHPNTSHSNWRSISASSLIDAPSSASEITLHTKAERLRLLVGAPKIFPDFIPLGLTMLLRHRPSIGAELLRR